MTPTLKAGDTLLVSWQHWFLPRILNSLDPPSPRLYEKWPEKCRSREFTEPTDAQEPDGTGDCYGIIWQLLMTRPRMRPGVCLRAGEQPPRTATLALALARTLVCVRAGGQARVGTI